MRYRCLCILRWPPPCFRCRSDFQPRIRRHTDLQENQYKNKRAGVSGALIRQYLRNYGVIPIKRLHLIIYLSGFSAFSVLLFPLYQYVDSNKNNPTVVEFRAIFNIFSTPFRFVLRTENDIIFSDILFLESWIYFGQFQGVQP